MSKNKGFCMFFDWVDRLKELDGNDAFSIVVALSEYFQYGTNPVDRFSGALKMAVGMMFDQIKRAEAKSAILRENINKRWNSGTSSVIQTDTFVIQTDTDVLQTDTTNTKTKTNTNTETDTISTTTTTTDIPDTCIARGAFSDKKVEDFPDMGAYLESDEYRFYNLVADMFAEYDRVCDTSADDFIAYNRARQWRGSGGELIVKDEDTLHRYVAKWVQAQERKGGNQ